MELFLKGSLKKTSNGKIVIMKNQFKIITLMLTATTLAACSTSDKNKLDYQSANNKVRSLEIPPDLRDPRQGDLYTLPTGVKADPNALKSNPAAATRSSQVLTPVKNAQIQRSGTQRWLHIDDKDNTELWALLRAFWQENGFTLESEEPQAGIMETDWAENRAKLPNQGVRKLFDKVGLGGVYTTSERDKFMIRMELNNKGGYDIFFTHKGLEEVYDSKKEDSTMWQPRANDPNLEAAFLSRFMQYLGVDEATAKQQTRTQNDQQTGSQFAKLENNSVLVYGEAERNVNRIGSALDRVGLIVQNFVSERGMFVVRPAPKTSDVLKQANQKTGILDKMFGKKKETESTDTSAPQMFVALEQVSNGQRIHLLDQFGKPYQGADANKLLNNLYLQLR